MSLELFMITIKEYNRFAQQLDLKYDYSNMESFEEEIYIAIHIRLMLLRKYVSKNQTNTVYLEDIIHEAKKVCLQEVKYLEDLANRFLKVYEESFTQILSDGTKLNLYETIEDTMYGFLLHADQFRIERLTLTDENLRFFCIKEYVESIESIVLELYDFLEKMNVSYSISNTHNRAPVVYLGELTDTSQQIKKSPYWTNMYGNDADDYDIKQLTKDFTKEDRHILNKVDIFLNELKRGDVSKKVIKKIIYRPMSKTRWGDFTKAIDFFNQIPNPGISSKVRYDGNRRHAYVYVFPNVDSPFIISTPHVISGIYCVTLIKNAFGEWRIFSFSGRGTID